MGRSSFKQFSTPQAVSAGVVKGWLRNTTIGAISTWTDVLNPASPAAQSTQGNKPIGNSNLSISPDGVDDFLSWPSISTINNASVQQGFAFWLKPRSTLAVFQFHFGAQGANPRYGLYNNGGGNGLRFDVIDGSGVTRHFDTPNGSITLNTSVFVTVECRLSSADDITITLNSVPQTLTVANGSPITSLRITTSNHQFHRRNDNTLPSPAMLGQNFFPLQGVMPGAVAGRMLTTAATTALMNLDILP